MKKIGMGRRGRDISFLGKTFSLFYLPVKSFYRNGRFIIEQKKSYGIYRTFSYISMGIGFIIFFAFLYLLYRVYFVTHSFDELRNFISNPDLLKYAGFIILFIVIILIYHIFFRPIPRVVLDTPYRRILFGRYEKDKLVKKIEEVNFDDIGELEILRNFEPERHYRTSDSRVRGEIESYELNIYNRTTNKWLGIYESPNRDKIIKDAEEISKIIGLPYKEKSVTEAFVEYLPDTEKIENIEVDEEKYR